MIMASKMKTPHISVCICTFRRPQLLSRLLEELKGQVTLSRFTFSIVVADNDWTESARVTVATFIDQLHFSQLSPSDVTYTVERVPNIALARNAALAHARGDYAAFIDDDEFPSAHWLLNLYDTLERYQVEGVLGPVLPHFDTEPPAWVRKGGFFNRPRHATGFELGWKDCRTGNVLFNRRVLAVLDDDEPFRSQFGTGGEDVDFFERVIAKGCRFVWCDAAIAYEVQEPYRWDVRLMVRRALLRGKNNWKLSDGRWRRLAKSLLALPLYTLSLPIMLLRGYDRYVKTLIRMGDHGGKVLAALNLNPVKTR